MGWDKRTYLKENLANFFQSTVYPMSKWNFFHQSDPFSTCVRIYHVEEQCSWFGEKNNICYLSDNVLQITDYKILSHQKL